ncbi:MAG: DUF6612 family protein [Dehalococcoidia bacterium]
MNFPAGLKRTLAPLAAIAFLAVPMLAATGCSKTTTPANAAEVVRLAGEKTGSADSVHFEMKITMSGILGSDVEMKADGDYDLVAQQMQMSMDAVGQKTETVMDGSTMYLKMPALGDGWYRMDVSELLDQAGSLNSAYEDPTKILSWLSTVGDDVTLVGSDSIRGEDADHYRATVNLRKAAAEMGASQAEAVEKALELLGDENFDVDVWVNDAGFPVRLRYEMSFANSEVKMLQKVVAKYSLDYMDWGEPVAIDVPDSSQVKDFKDFQP